MMLPVGEFCLRLFAPRSAKARSHLRVPGSARFLLSLIAGAVCVLALAACSAAPTAAPITLNPGNFTALGVNPKSAQPTSSDMAALQAAEAGSLQQPSFVEFYGDT